MMFIKMYKVGLESLVERHVYFRGPFHRLLMLPSVAAGQTGRKGKAEAEGWSAPT